MRQFLSLAIPVRMCMAKGTCHFERFSIESFSSFNLTRSMFYGSGIVFAVEGEETSGPGCRIFLHESISAQDREQIEKRVPVLPTPVAKEHVKHELNYLHEPTPPAEADAATQDMRLFAGLALLRN